MNELFTFNSQQFNCLELSKPANSVKYRSKVIINSLKIKVQSSLQQRQDQSIATLSRHYSEHTKGKILPQQNHYPQKEYRICAESNKFKRKDDQFRNQSNFGPFKRFIVVNKQNSVNFIDIDNKNHRQRSKTIQDDGKQHLISQNHNKYNLKDEKNTSKMNPVVDLNISDRILPKAFKLSYFKRGSSRFRRCINHREISIRSDLIQTQETELKNEGSHQFVL